MYCGQLAPSGREQIPPLLFPTRAGSGLGDALPDPGGLSALLSPPIQMLLSPGNPPRTHPEVVFSLGTPGPVRSTHEINRHNGLFVTVYGTSKVEGINADFNFCQ